MRKAATLALLFASAVALTWSGGSAPAAAAGPKPSASVELYANLSAGTTSEFEVIGADGQLSGTPFALPSGRVLVVTDVLVTPNVVDGVYEGNLNSTGGNENRIRFRVDSNVQAMLHLPLASGLVFSTTPQAFAFATNPGACVVRLLGSLQKAK
jgi:hypothetical protein